MSTKIIIDASLEPLALNELKKQCEADQDSTVDDEYLNNIIKEVREYAEKETGRSLVDKTYKETLEQFPSGDLLLIVGGAHTVNNIKYIDQDDNLQTIDPLEYESETDDEQLQVRIFTHWPPTKKSLKAVQIEYVAGYGQPVDVPPLIKKAMLMLGGTLYSVREIHINGVQQNRTVISVENILQKFKVNWL